MEQRYSVLQEELQAVQEVGAGVNAGTSAPRRA